MYLKDLETMNNHFEDERNYDLEVLFNSKLESAEKTINYIKYLDMNDILINEEIKRLQNLKKSNSTKKERAKNYIYYLSEILKTKKFKLHTIFTKETTSIEIDNIDINKIPEDFINKREIKTISKEKIKDYLLSPRHIDQETGEIIYNNLNFARLKKSMSIIVK